MSTAVLTDTHIQALVSNLTTRVPPKTTFTVAGKTYPPARS